MAVKEEDVKAELVGLGYPDAEVDECEDEYVSLTLNPAPDLIINDGLMNEIATRIHDRFEIQHIFIRPNATSNSAFHLFS